MRILHVSSAKTYGGGERHIVDLCRELTNRGHEIYVALRPTNEWQDRLDFLPPERFLYVSIRNSFGALSTKPIARFVEKEKIGAIHAHVARDYLAASIACRIARSSRLVITRHFSLPLKPFHRFALRNVSAVIAVSADVRAHLERTFPAEKIYMIPNGIELEESTPRMIEDKKNEFRALHGIPRDAPLVLATGELKVAKGQRDLVLAANEIVKSIPECRFVIVGKDNSIDQQFRRELKRLVRIFGLEDRFLWLDWLDDLSDLLWAADIYVSPSHAESFGSAILDAMAASTAVVATETYGAIDLIRDKNALVPIRDPIALAERIGWFLDNNQARIDLGHLLKATAGEMFSLDRMVDATEKVYQRVLGS